MSTDGDFLDDAKENLRPADENILSHHITTSYSTDTQENSNHANTLKQVLIVAFNSVRGLMLPMSLRTPALSLIP